MDAIVLSTKNPLFYKKQVRVEYLRLKQNTTIQKPEPIHWDKLQELEGDLHSIDTINGLIVHKQVQPIPIDLTTNTFVKVVGWAVDEKAGDVANSIYATLDCKSITLAHCGVNRLDVTKFFGIEKYKFSGFETNISFDNIDQGIHKVSLRIVSKDKKSNYMIEGGIMLKVLK